MYNGHTIILEIMNKEERLQVLKDAHQKYVDWWMPIDVAAGSLMGAMCRHRFYETLLTYEGGWGGVEDQQIKSWWNEWLGEYTSIADKTIMKQFILKLVIGHYKGIVDLNKKDE